MSENLKNGNGVFSGTGMLDMLDSSLSFALTSSRFCSADKVDTFTSARRRFTIILKAVSGSGLLQICCTVSSSNKLSTSLCRGSTDCDSVNVSFFDVSAGISIERQGTQHVCQIISGRGGIT